VFGADDVAVGADAADVVLLLVLLLLMCAADVLLM
jgi:hypothetical protein